MIKTVLTTTCAFALMTGVAFAQAKTNGGTTRGPNSPTSANSGTTLSTGQTQPLNGGSYSTISGQPGLNTTTGSATGGPGTNPNGGPPITMPTAAAPSSSTTASSTMPQSTAAPTMIANTPTGEAPAKYPKCTHRGQDRCMSMARR